MINHQKPAKPIRGFDGCYSVQEVFYTIQGEGPFAGRPAVFIRFNDCNLQCPLCDTDYTSHRSYYTADELVQVVKSAHGDYQGRPLVVITGGEPFRQFLMPLLRALIQGSAYQVQIESNGTLAPRFRDDSDPGTFKRFYDWGMLTVVVSPKTHRIVPELDEYIIAYKYVLKYGDDDVTDGLPIHALDHPVKGRLARPQTGRFIRTYLQPADEPDKPGNNQLNLNAVIHNCMKFGYTLCLQTHKIVNLP